MFFFLASVLTTNERLTTVIQIFHKTQCAEPYVKKKRVMPEDFSLPAALENRCELGIKQKTIHSNADTWHIYAYLGEM